MRIIRLMLIASMLLTVYSIALMVYLVPFAWVGLVVIGVRLAYTRRQEMWSAFGTARWANQNDLKGMIDEE